MSTVVAVTERLVPARPEVVYGLLADYRARAALLPPAFREYDVTAGGQGAGTAIHYVLQATERRQRTVDADVSEPLAGRVLVEQDRNSTLETRWTLEDAGGTTRVVVRVSWRGARGIGGIFEGFFAPIGVRRLYAAVLTAIATELDRSRRAARP